ncbi:MAG: hypothetical protein QMA99_07020 [Flavobacterium sp.]
MGWEVEIASEGKYVSTNIINIENRHHAYTGEAHGYQGPQSLLLDPNTRKTILQH